MGSNRKLFNCILLHDKVSTVLCVNIACNLGIYELFNAILAMQICMPISRFHICTYVCA